MGSSVARFLPLSPCGLRRAHISESPTLSHLFEAMPTTAHGDRPRWALGSVTGPATEPRDNPGEPGDRLPGMRVLLFGGVAFETILQGLEQRQLFLRDYVGGRAIDGAVSGEDQLHDLGGGDHCDGGELEQGFGRFDLAALDVETLALAGAEQLFDVPALAIPADDLQCLRNRRNLMSGKETPMDRLLDGGIKLPDLDQAQGQLTRGRGIAAVARALDRHFSKAQRYLGRASRTAGLGSDLQLEAMPDRPAFGNAKQPAPPHQCAIATGAGEQMGARVGYPVKFFVDIALAVADYCDHRRRGKRALGARRPLNPTIGFLLFDRLTAVIGGRWPLTRPDLHPSQPEQGSAARIDRQHGMHKQARITPVAGRAKPPYPSGVPGVVQFRRVLDRKHMQARDTGRQNLSAMPGNFVRCHIRIVQPAAEPHPLSSAVGRRTQVHRDAFNGALQQQRPLFASRASPKRPTDQSIRSIIAVILLVDRNARNQTRFTPGKKNVIENCVHALAPCGRGIGGLRPPYFINYRTPMRASATAKRRRVRGLFLSMDRNPSSGTDCA